MAIARSLIPEAERHIADVIGADRLDDLRHDRRAILAATRRAYGHEFGDAG